MASYQVTFNIQAVFDLWCDLQGVDLPHSHRLRPVSLVCCRLRVVLWSFCCETDYVPIHSKWISIAYHAASNTLLPLSISLCSALSTISLRHPSRLLSAVPYMHSQSVSFSRLYTLDEISHSEYIRKGVRERGERDEDDELICYRIICLRYDRSLHHADHLFGRHVCFFIAHFIHLFLVIHKSFLFTEHRTILYACIFCL